MTRKIVLILPVLVLAAACGSSGAGPAGAPAQGAATSPPSAAATKAQQDAEKAEKSVAAEKAAKDQILAIKGLTPPSVEDEVSVTEDDVTVTDPATGEKVVKVARSAAYYVKNGRLFNSLIPDPTGVPVVREDAEFWYTAAPVRKEAPPSDPEGIDRINVVPPREGEVVTPKASKKGVLFAEESQGLPTTGMWRENFTVVDLDGDGRPEIVTSAPRMSALSIGIFKKEGTSWRVVTPTFESGDAFTPGYGGIAAADVDGDGRPDLVLATHDGGLFVLRNLGSFRFRVERSGLPGKPFSSRAVQVGDIDGDGKPDVLALSDVSEWESLEARDKEGRPLGQKDASGYLKGYHGRSFFRRADGTFREDDEGLQWTCHGTALALEAKPRDGGAPFFVSSCNVLNFESVVYSFDRAAKRWERQGQENVIESYSFHSGVAVGTYRGLPAAFAAYMKLGPDAASPPMKGTGVTVYYRDRAEWKAKRILKRLGQDAMTRGLAVGDVDGDGLDDVVWADDVEKRVRIFLQTPDGEFEEASPGRPMTFTNQPTCLRLADLDGDGRLDIVLMYQYLTNAKTRSGGLRVFLNQPAAGKKMP